MKKRTYLNNHMAYYFFIYVIHLYKCIYTFCTIDDEYRRKNNKQNMRDLKELPHMEKKIVSMLNRHHFVCLVVKIDNKRQKLNKLLERLEEKTYILKQSHFVLLFYLFNPFIYLYKCIYTFVQSHDEYKRKSKKQNMRDLKKLPHME